MHHQGRRVTLLTTLVAFGLAGMPATGAGPEMRVRRVQEAPAPSAIEELGGFAGRRFRANMNGYLRTFDIEQYVRLVEERQHSDWWWIGEQDGKWIESAVLASEQAGDASLGRQGRRMLARVIGSQEPGGYVGITPEAMRTKEKPLRGMDAYELYFKLHALITAYEQWGDAVALRAARRLGDYFTTYIGPGKAEFWPSPYRPPENVNTIVCPQVTWVPEGTRKAGQLHVHSDIAGHTAHYGWEGTLLIDPMLRLYQVTGDASYLDWSRWVIGRLDTWSGWQAYSNLDKVADGTMGVHELQPYVHAHTFQMNFLGLLRMYQITGDVSYLRKVVGAWKDIAARQMYITGGVSVGEHYEPGRHLPIRGHVVETCASMSWIELTQYLLELTGEARYADAIERLLWNHVYAAQTVDGDSNRYHTPLNGAKPAGYFHGPDCCTASGHRIQSKVPMLVYGQADERVFVNQFIASRATLRLSSGTRVSIRQETDYPAGETIILHVKPHEPEEFTLCVRVPGWCEDARAILNGQALETAVPGTYMTLRRRWQQGDRLELMLPMRPHWVRGDHATAGMTALARGPVVYALDTVWWDSDDRMALGPLDGDLSEAAFLASTEPTMTLVPAPDGALGPGYQVRVRLLDGRAVEPILLPFANIGQWYCAGDAEKPDRNAAVFHYAIWLRNVDSPGFEHATGQWRVRQAWEKQTVDLVRPADPDSERAHGLQGGNHGAGQFQSRGWRHAHDGWFSYRLKVLPDVPVALECTYWGSDAGSRAFDILADGQIIATQTLAAERPDEFFNVRYPIPSELTDNKREVTIRFQAHPGQTAGGVFGCRVVKRDE